MPTIKPVKDRRHDGPRLKVKHLHRVDLTVVERVSELVYVKGTPVALLEWIDLGGLRIPLVACELEPGKLRAAAQRGGVFQYDAVTVDPRFAYAS